jgi:HNH endonuclease
MLAFKGQLPDVDGALFEAVINKMIDEMRPAKGQPWETRARRGADALIELVRNYADHKAVLVPSPLFVVQVPPSGPATIAGIPLPDGMVENLRASAKVKPVLLDEHGIPVAAGRRSGSLSPRIANAVLLRDGHCRMHCDRRHGLQIHHLWPVSWGGTDEIANLAAVCVAGGTDHHQHLAPHGPFLLLGNPNRPDGLRLVHRDELPAIAHLAGLEAVLDLNRHRAITAPELLDRYLKQIRAGPVAA